MYDVLFMQRTRGCTIVASRVERESAARIARQEARSRRVSRMFLAGSACVPHTDAVLIVRSGAGTG
jgi:hypothetical protein